MWINEQNAMNLLGLLLDVLQQLQNAATNYIAFSFHWQLLLQILSIWHLITIYVVSVILNYSIIRRRKLMSMWRFNTRLEM